LGRPCALVWCLGGFLIGNEVSDLPALVEAKLKRRVGPALNERLAPAAPLKIPPGSNIQSTVARGGDRAPVKVAPGRPELGPGSDGSRGLQACLS
jgi:hypothetical protein